MTTPTLQPPPATFHCPLCDYNLTGLTNPQCPECGHAFEWADFTDPARMNLPWLFEHRRWFRGYFSTQRRLFWPPLFFSLLKPTHKINLLRLFLFALLGVSPVLLMLPLPLFASTAAVYQQGQRLRLQAANPSSPILRYYRRSPQYAGLTDTQLLDQIAPPPTTRAFWRFVRGQTEYSWAMPGQMQPLSSYRFAIAASVPASVIAATITMWLILRTTRRRASVTPRQTFRLFVYCFDPAPTFLLLLILFSFGVYRALASPRNLANSYYSLSADTYIFLTDRAPLLCLLASLIALFRIHFAARSYLRLPHTPGITAFTAIIAFLLLAILFKFTGWYWLL